MKRISRGMTLVEVAIGTAVIAVITLVIAGLLKTGIRSYNYTIGRVAALSNARRALDGEGSVRGMLWATREASSVGELSPSALTLSPPSGPAVVFSLSGTTLRQADALGSKDQAKGVVSLQISYYSLDELGRIEESTSPAAAVLVTPTLTMRTFKENSVTFFGGAALQNR